MSNKVWIITGAGRGMGVNIAKSALEAGHRVVATGRNTERVRNAVGEHENLFATQLDITDEGSAQAAVKAAVERFGRIDVLVNNAGNFYAGFFETVAPADFRAQMETNFFGAVNVTRAVLPVMRKQRSGQVVTITSLAGIVAGAFTSAYAASKFALEGWMEALHQELSPFGIKTTVVEPGFFRTELLMDDVSTKWPSLKINDYAEQVESTVRAWKQMNGQQSGDPAKLGKALVEIVDMKEPPERWVAGADCVAAVVQKADKLREQANRFPDLSNKLAH